MKRVLAVVLTILILFSVMPTGVFSIIASAETTDGYYTYFIENNEATIITVDESISGNIVIPSTLGNYPVTKIYDYAFFNCDSITNVTIPDSVNSIGESAFYRCTSLATITIPNSVTSIGAFAFSGCGGLKYVKLGSRINSMGEKVFNACYNLEEVLIAEGLTKIGDFAFLKNMSLKTVTLPKTLKEIGMYAFYYCYSLENIYYTGNKTNKSNIYIGVNNDWIIDSNWHYNTCTGSHEYSYVCDEICNKCDYIRTALPHKYTNSCDKGCNVCKSTRIAGHIYKTFVDSKATLTKNGKTVKKCSECGWVATGSAVTVKSPKTIKLSATRYTYNGKVKTPTVTVKDSSGKVLKKNTDFTVTYPSGRKNVGTYKIKVTFKGKYSGTKYLTFKINPINISKCKISLSTTRYIYNGKIKTPLVTVKNAGGTKLTKNTHYTVTYATGRKNVGKYKVTIKMKGNYTGTKNLYFTINPPKTTVSKLTASKKSIKVYVGKKTSQVTGYQIQYATSKNFKSAKTKTITSYKTTSTTLTKLTSKKTYYVRVRTYKTVSGKKYYSSWSTYKSAKAK